MYDSSSDIVSEFKDLGLLVSYNLCWNSHINHIVSSAIKMLGLILCKGLFLCKCIKDSLLFISEIPAGVQPGCLSPHTKRSIDLIECVQRRATKLILKCDSNLV